MGAWPDTPGSAWPESLATGATRTLGHQVPQIVLPIPTPWRRPLAPLEAPWTFRSYLGRFQELSATENGKAVAGVRLSLPGTSSEATTDADGRYELPRPRQFP